MVILPDVSDVTLTFWLPLILCFDLTAPSSIKFKCTLPFVAVASAFAVAEAPTIFLAV